MNLIDILLDPLTLTTASAVAETLISASSTQKKKTKAVNSKVEKKMLSTKQVEAQNTEDEITDVDSNDRLKNKPDSALILWMLQNSKQKIDIPILAKYLKCQTQSLRNKLNRNSFSVDDLLITAYACDFSISIKNDSNEELYAIDPKVYFSSKDSETWERISSLKEKKYAEKKAEYDELKAKLDLLEKEFQFSKIES